jgi:carbonic anhydrase
MALIDTLVAWNHAATTEQGAEPLDLGAFADALPLIALTCIDPRLNAILPGAMGLPAEQFIWLRNAGNVITSSTSSTVRSLALACAVKGGHEIAIIGHTDCGVRKTGVAELTDRFHELGVPREKLPHDLVEFFGVFASERQNVMRGVDFVRRSPIIGPAIPVHGLLIDVHSAKLEWVVNGYDALDCVRTQLPEQKVEENLAPPDVPEPPQLPIKPKLPKSAFKVVSFPPRIRR